MFPHTHYPNAQLSQLSLSASIPRLITQELRFPKRASGLGNVTAPRTPVPETAVNKNSQLLVIEIEVGFSRKFGGMQPPPSDACTHQSTPERPFGALVAFAFDGRHNGRTNWRDPGKRAVLQFQSEVALH